MAGLDLLGPDFLANLGIQRSMWLGCISWGGIFLLAVWLLSLQTYLPVDRTYKWPSEGLRIPGGWFPRTGLMENDASRVRCYFRLGLADLKMDFDTPLAQSGLAAADKSKWRTECNNPFPLGSPKAPAILWRYARPMR
jgi:hypothetical protein